MQFTYLRGPYLRSPNPNGFIYFSEGRQGGGTLSVIASCCISDSGGTQRKTPLLTRMGYKSNEKKIYIILEARQPNAAEGGPLGSLIWLNSFRSLKLKPQCYELSLQASWEPGPFRNRYNCGSVYFGPFVWESPWFKGLITLGCLLCNVPLQEVIFSHSHSGQL